MQEDDELLDATAALIRQAREVVPGYAAGKVLVGSWELAKLLRHTRSQVVERRFASRARGLAIPDYDADGPIHLIGIDSAHNRTDHACSIRHELAHVLCGEAEEAVYLTDEDTLSFPERRADLFAVADLVPAGFLEVLRMGPRGGVRPWSHVRLEVAHTFRELTGWSELRVWDRARLRVRLYRERGV